MGKRASFAVNMCIASVLMVLGMVIFTTDISSVFLTVTPPLRHGNRTLDKTALMVHVDRDTGHLYRALDILHETGASATFFLSNHFVENNPSMVWYLSQGFEVGNMGPDILVTHDLIRSFAGTYSSLFTVPPGLSPTRTMLRTADRIGYRTILPAGTVGQDSPWDNGDIIMFELNYYSLAALPITIRNLQDAGRSVVSVGEIL